LAAPAEAPVPKHGDVAVEGTDRRAVRRHGVVGEIAGDNLAEPFPGVRDRHVPALPQPFAVADDPLVRQLFDASRERTLILNMR
jgi:hypothetical protein